MKLPELVLPILHDTLASPLVPAGTPLEIWRAENHRIWVDCFIELAARLFQSDIPEDALPRGYALVAYLFDWEAQCQFDGWGALGNRADVMPQIIAAYEDVGLADEAQALRKALAAWESTDGDHDATSAAYGEVRHDYSIDLDRMEHLACYFIDNADRLFYVPG